MAVHSSGADLQLGNGAGPEVFASVGCIHDIAGPEISVTSTETTCLADSVKSFMAGNADGGEVTFTIDYLEATYTTLYNTLQDAAKNWKIVFPGAEEIDFAGFITRLGLTIPYDDRIVVPVTIKVTGMPSAPA